MRKILSFVFLSLVGGILTQCQVKNLNKTEQAVVNKTIDKFDVSPVYSPEESLGLMRVEDGFEVKLVAAEPLISTPVTMSFDAKGRMWVVEMESYMPDTLGTGENEPKGKIVILTDKNKDGVADDRKVFLDSLVLPRGMCLVEDGILVIEPPRLWYYEIKNDKPGKKILVDPTYGEGGNAESQANGLYPALDNWIYSAASDRRYRRIAGKWVIERTHRRGQWGLTQDNHGRLYFNNNTQNLLGDYFAPGFGAENNNMRSVAGFSEKILFDNKVYPIRPTPGVNRGYKEGTLDEQKRLVSFTAACGPVIYRGDLFGDAYANNAFVAEPAANLIKRNILTEKGYETAGQQAYQQREFLASFDERFRPVSLYNGPNGALYVVDMYRGIIQHKAFLTSYLKKEIRTRNLSQPLTHGRIYKVVPKNSKAQSVTFPKNPQLLVKLLNHPNGWVRDFAQQLLISRRQVQAVPALRKALSQTEQPLLVVHALWTLEGLGALQPTDVMPLLQNTSWALRMQGLSVLPAVLNQQNHPQFISVLSQMVSQKDTLAAPYVAYLVQSLQPLNEVAANGILKKIMLAHPNNKYVVDAVISNVRGKETAFMKEVQAAGLSPNTLMYKRMNVVLADIQNSKQNGNTLALLKEFPRGANLFKTTCQACHGADGNGVKMLAPPLNQSEWVTGDKNRLISIVLFGLTGPVKVNGTVYKVPEVSGEMPGIAYNPDVVEDDIAQLLSFIRKSWSNNADKVTGEDVSNVRKQYIGRQQAFTVEELAKNTPH